MSWQEALEALLRELDEMPVSDAQRVHLKVSVGRVMKLLLLDLHAQVRELLDNLTPTPRLSD